jgi:phage baseplate assembly protein gpV
MSVGPASPEPGDGIAPVIKVNGAELGQQAQNAVLSVRVDRGLGLVGRATIRLWDQGFVLSSSSVFPLGGTVVISTFGPRGVELLSGSITSVSLDVSTRGSELVVVVDDGASKLMAPLAPKGFASAKPADVLTAAAGAAGLRTNVEGGCLGSDVQPYLFHVGSGLAYLEAACARTGAIWWMDQGILQVRGTKDPVRTVTLDLTKDLLAFSVKASTLPSTAYEARGWDVAQKKAVVGEAKTKAVVSTESEFVAGAAGRSGNQGPTRSNLLVRDAAPMTQLEAETVAKARADEAARSAVVVRGTCTGVAGLGPDVDVTIREVGPANGTYRVTRVEHVYTGSQGLVTHFTAGPLRPTGLVDTLGPRPDDAGTRLTGVVVGIVTNNKDPENMGRVKVKVPDLADTVESAWARVAMVGAGASRGVFFLPEINDEVLVTFEAGDTRRPLVLGGLYGGKTKSPLTSDQAVAASAVSKRQIVSRLGHVIELSDGEQPAEKHVQLKNADGQLIRVGSDKVTVDSAGKPIEILGASGSSIKVDASGAVTIEGSKITLKSASGPVQVEGTQVTVKGSGPVSVESQATTTVKGSMTSVSASGVLEVKGSMVKIN